MRNNLIVPLTDLEKELIHALATLVNCLAAEPFEQVTMKMQLDTLEAKMRGTEVINRIALDYPAGNA